MILKHQVAEVAKSHITEVLKEYPGAARVILNPSYFDKWCELATYRCNSIDMYFVSKQRTLTQSMMTQFIQDAARAYARKQLERTGEYQGLKE